MHKIPTRSEKHYEMIQKFIESDSASISLRLYSREITKLSKEFPMLDIEKGEKNKDKLYQCQITRITKR